jgi:UDPglucose 6-dehydrogenase
MEPDRIVIGAFDVADGDVIAKLHEGIDAPIVRCDVPSAEMVKLAANAALVTRISFINEIANVCEATGADVVKVAEGVGLDHRLGPHFLKAGIGLFCRNRCIMKIPAMKNRIYMILPCG